VTAPVHIPPPHPRPVFDLAVIGNSHKAGTVLDAPGGVPLENHGTMAYKIFGIPEMLEFVVDASIATDVGLFTAWLYDKVKSRPVEKITIRDTVITEITEASIRETLQREIEIQR
jgi:hypothetical protein